MKVPASPGASVASVAGSGPVRLPTVPVPVTTGASGMVLTAAVVPVLATVSATVTVWPSLTLTGVASMAAEIEASALPTAV